MPLIPANQMITYWRIHVTDSELLTSATDVRSAPATVDAV